MSEQFKEQEEMLTEAQEPTTAEPTVVEAPVVETPVVEAPVVEAPVEEAPVEEAGEKKDLVFQFENGPEFLQKLNPWLTKKNLIIAGSAFLAVIVLLVAILHKPKFERVKDECVHIAGMVSGSGDYFTIDTYPDAYENMDSTVRSLLLPGAQENALEAIRYANEELGFGGYVYSNMMETSALMGRQSETNGKYTVSWTYHPDDGLEVTYHKN